MVARRRYEKKNFFASSNSLKEVGEIMENEVVDNNIMKNEVMENEIMTKEIIDSVLMEN